MGRIFLFLFIGCLGCVAQPLAVIFLDIDGVLVRDWETDGKWLKVVEIFGEKEYYTPA